MLKQRDYGFTLLETVMALAIGSIMMMVIVSFYPQWQRQSLQLYRLHRLEQALLQAILSLEKDLQRAGFAFVPDTKKSVIITDGKSFNKSCVVIRYDFNRSGTIEEAGSDPDIFAYRWQDGMFSHARGKSQCDSDGWERLLDPSEIRVTDFSVEQIVNEPLDVGYFIINIAAYWVSEPRLTQKITRYVRGYNLF